MTLYSSLTNTNSKILFSMINSYLNLEVNFGKIEFPQQIIYMAEDK